MLRVRERRSRRLAAALLVAALASASSVAAQTAGEPPPAPAPGTLPAVPSPPAIDTSPAVPPSTGKPLPAPEPGSVMRRPEMLSHKPSGFWTSNRPAEGGAYRWGIMAPAAVVLLISIFFLARALRRASRERVTAPR